MTTRYAILNDDDSVRMLVVQDAAPLERHVVVSCDAPRPAANHLTLVSSANGELSWVDRRSPAQRQAAQWTAIRQQRGDEETAGFEFEGRTFQSDLVSQMRIAHVAAAARRDPELVVPFVTATNDVVELDADQLQGLQAALGRHLLDCCARAQIRRNEEGA